MLFPFPKQESLIRGAGFVGLGKDDRKAVEHDDSEADGHHHEGGVDVGKVGDLALHRGYDSGAKDGHDKAGGADLRVSADIFQREPVDGREHKREGDGNRENRANAEPAGAHAVAKHDDKGHGNADNGRPDQEFGGRHVLHQPGEDEAGDNEDDDCRYLVVAGQGFADVEFPDDHADGERPSADLSAHVEEEGQNAEYELPVLD